MGNALLWDVGRECIFQVSVEVNRLRGFQEILAHFVVKSTPIDGNCNYYKRMLYILCLVCKKYNK